MDIKGNVQRQIHKCREIVSQRWDIKYDQPTLTMRVPKANPEISNALELGINIGWIEGLEYVKDWIEAEEELNATRN